MLLTMNCKNIIQCTVIGDGMVGKTSLSKVFAGHGLPENYIATVFDNYAGNTSVNGEHYTISVFDSTGEHDFEDFRALCYRHSEVCVICYSVMDKESYDSVKNFWLPEIQHCKGHKIPILLVATQIDFRKTHRYNTITKEKGYLLAKDIGAEHYIECSIFDCLGIENVFEQIVLTALKYRKRKNKIMHKFLRI